MNFIVRHCVGNLFRHGGPDYPYYPLRIPRSAPNGEALEEVVLVSFVDLREAFIAIPARPVECHGCHTMILLEALQIYP